MKSKLTELFVIKTFSVAEDSVNYNFNIISTLLQFYCVPIVEGPNRFGGMRDLTYFGGNIWDANRSGKQEFQPQAGAGFLDFERS